MVWTTRSCWKSFCPKYAASGRTIAKSFATTVQTPTKWPARATRGPRSRCGRPSRSRSIGLVLALRLVRGDAHDRRTLDVDDVVHLEVELPGSPRGDELHREVRLFEQVRVMDLADPFERHLE